MVKFVELAGGGLSSQIAKLKAHAEILKRRTVDEVKRQVVHMGVTIGIAFLGAFLAMMTIVTGLIALYVWVAESEGPYVAFAAVGGSTAVLAVLMFIVAAARTPSRRTATSPAWVAGAAPNSSFVATVKQDLLNRTAAATREALASTGDVLRKGSPQTILGTLAFAFVIGVIVGRRR
jgi:hypothetical protein